MCGQRTCSFCGKAEDTVHRLFEGPKDLICDECVKLCVEVFAEHKPGRPRTDRKETLSCSFCRKTEDEVDCLIAGPTVFICDGCAVRFDRKMPT